MALVLKRNVTANEEVEIVQEVERCPTVLQFEIAKHIGLAPSSLSSIMLLKLTVLE
jgi:hypothetical protein